MREVKSTLVTLNPSNPMPVNPKGTRVVELRGTLYGAKGALFNQAFFLKRRERETGEIGDGIRMREGKSTLVTLNPKNPTPINPKGTRDIEVGVHYVAPKAPPSPSMKSILKSVGGRETGEIGDGIRMQDGKSTLVTLNPKKPKPVNPKGTRDVEVGGYNVAPKAPPLIDV